MADETTDNNSNDPLSEAPGWASSGGENNVAPPAQPVPPQTPPPAAAQYPQQSPYGEQPAYGQQPGYGQQPNFQNNPPKKKSKLWLWITLAIVIPLLLCGLGVGGCAFWAYNETKPAIDATNEFYAAAQKGSDLSKIQCEAATNQDVDFNDDMQSIEDQLGEIDSYNFSSIETDSSSEFDITVSGTVTRDGQKVEAIVGLNKDNGTFKVCGVRENP